METLAYRKVIEELVRGREFAHKLRQVINGSGNDDDGSAAATTLGEKLLKEIHMSFSNSLFILNNQSNCGGGGDQSSQEVCDDVKLIREPSKSEDSQESNCKSSIVKERRGCYKRRKTSESWVRESETPAEDGHQWRKYGQKMILKAKYPRNYYRCSHKYDQGCKATKQVQRIQEDPPLHKTTYFGNHTCRMCQSSCPELIVLDDSVSPNSESSMFLSFDNSLPTPIQKHCPFLSSFPSPSSVKGECKEEEEEVLPPSISSSNDYLISSSELTFHDSPPTFDSDDHMGVMIDPDVLYGSAELDDVFEPFLEGLR